MFKEDLSKSSSTFNEYIKKELETKLCVKTVSTEDNNSVVAKILDLYAGIDYLLVSKKGVRGLASRIQEGKAWHTFTVRKEKTTGATTEYEKRVNALENDYITPDYTMQAYKTDKAIEYAICKTKDLYKHIKEHKESIKTRQTSNAEFLVIPWESVPCCKGTILL